MKKGGKLLTTLLAFAMIFSGTLGMGMTARADICGGLEEKDIYTPEAEDVIQDPVLHWTIRSAMNAVTSRPVLTKEMVGDKMVSYISFEQNRHPEDFEGWTKQYWIEDLEGIQYAKSAKMVNICYTSVVGKKIKSVEPVSKLTQLQTLLLKENGITDISSLGTLVNLQEFDVAGNEIDNMDSVAGMKNLKKLNVSSNKIADISSVSALSKLENLDISNNKVTTLPDMKNLGNVTYFNAANNNLTDISELSNLKHLQELDLSGNDGITDVKSLANLIYLDKDKTFLPDDSVKDDLFAVIDVNVLFNKFNISTMQQSQLEDVEKALDAYEALSDTQKAYIDDKRIAAAKENYDKVSKGEAPTYYPEYDEGGDRLPIFDRIEIQVLDKYGKPMPNITFTKKRESAYTSDEESVVTDANGKLILYHKSTDVFYDEILIYPKDDTYIANPDKISYAVLNRATDLINGKKATGLEDLKMTLIPKDEYVDKAELENAITEAGEITEDYKYTKDSWSRFEEAYVKAQEVYANVDASEQEVNDSKNALTEALVGLQKKEVLTALKLIVEDSNGNAFTRPFKFQMRVPQTGAEAWNEWSGKYTSTAYITASPAWEDGKEWEIVACNHEAYAMDPIYVTVGVADDGTRYFKTVDGQSVGVDFEKKVTVRKIAQALDPANEIAPDGSLLQEYIEEAKAYDASDYTPKTYKALSDAITEAEEILARTEIIQEDYNAAAAKIKSAEAGLTLLSDKTALEMEINLEFGLTKSDYTEESWSRYETALETAKRVDADANASADEIENARKALEEARLALDKKDTEPDPDPDPEPGDKVLSDATIFRARVQDEDGNPLSGITFTIEGKEDPSCSYERTTNENGVLEFAPNPSWDYGLTFQVFAESDNIEATPEKAIFVTDYEGKIISVNGTNLPVEDEVIFTVKKKDTPAPDPEPSDKVLSDATTFRARVQDEKGNPLSGITFYIDGVEDACKYTSSSNEKGILEYAPNAGDYDLEFTVSIYQSPYTTTPEKATFVTDSNYKIVSVNGKTLPVEDELIFVVKTGEEPKPEVDKAALKATLDQAKAVEKGNYTDDSWNALQQAISAAEAVYGDEQATEEEVNIQKAALEKAIAELKEKEPNPEPGDKILSDASTFRARVQDENGNPLPGIVFMIKAEEEPTCSYERTSNENGILEFTPNPADDYSLTFYVSVKDADVEAMPEKVTFNTNNISKIAAVNGKLLPVEDEIIFVVKTGEEPEPEVDKTALKAALDNAKAIEKGNYTDDSWNALQNAIEAAEAVYADEQATEEMVSVQEAALKAAITELKEKEVEPDKPNPDKPNPDKPGTDKPDQDKPGSDPSNPSKPESDSGNNNKPEKAGNSKVPQTGDTAQPFVYVIGMLVAAGAGTVVLRKKRVR